ncbi:MAG: XRE family transcriptional regulator [Spirochaetaceae bacterium]|jgi:DNA-binding transcriptional regulator YiaG|nr:XRE family transcriptional regulator [Spirochaetaceae bacterium]
MKKRYQSEILGVIHQDAQAMFKVGAISEARMREYDRDCLVPETSLAQTTKRSGASSIPVKPSRAYASKAN